MNHRLKIIIQKNWVVRPSKRKNSMNCMFRRMKTDMYVNGNKELEKIHRYVCFREAGPCLFSQTRM